MNHLHRGRALGHGPASESQEAGSQTRRETEDAYNEGEGQEGVGLDPARLSLLARTGPP